MSDVDREVRELAFKIHGMDCAEEVNLLKHEVGPIVGGDEHLSFDLLRGRMKVRLSDGTLAPSVIQDAVSRAGLTAEPWSDEKTPSEEAPHRQRRGRIIATVASGLACAMALASHALLRGGFGAAIGIERAGAVHDLPAVSIGLYGIAIGCGLFYVAPKAWLAVRRLRFDMNLLMTVAILGAVVIGEWFEAATVSFLFALSLALESWSLGRARRAVAALLDLAPPRARLLRADGTEAERLVEEVPVGSTVVIRAFGDGEAVFDFIEVFDQSHLWFEGLTFRFNGNETGFYSCLTNEGYDNGFQPMANDVDDIVLVRNVFEGYKHSIRLGPRTSGWYIADNVIVGDKQLGQSGTISFDGEGIELAHGGDHTVAHNSITLVADGISFPDRNCDIFGNDIFDVTDDGIELDNGLANTRAWGNRIHNAGHNGIGFQPMGGAPWYLVRNQIVNFQESAFKFRETDRFVALHNTIVNRGNILDHWADQMLSGVSRNNLWISLAGGQIWMRGHDPADWRTDLDYDGFHWGASSIPFVYEGVSYYSLKSLTRATGMEANGLRIGRGCFDWLDVPGPAPMTSVPSQWITLRASCAAVDAGVVLPNINDDFFGAAPDMGAYENGRPLPHYGPRE